MTPHRVQFHLVVDRVEAFTKPRRVLPLRRVRDRSRFPVTMAKIRAAIVERQIPSTDKASARKLAGLSTPLR